MFFCFSPASEWKQELIMKLSSVYSVWKAPIFDWNYKLLGSSKAQWIYQATQRSCSQFPCKRTQGWQHVRCPWALSSVCKMHEQMHTEWSSYSLLLLFHSCIETMRRRVCSTVVPAYCPVAFWDRQFYVSLWLRFSPQLFNHTLV